jgi:dynein heavy chain
VRSLCNLLETMISPKNGFNFNQHSEIVSRYIKYVFVYCMIWSLGATVNTDDFSKIDLFIRNQFQNIIIPNQDNVYGFYLDESSISFRLWSDKTPVF